MMAPGRETRVPRSPDRAHKLRIKAVMMCKDTSFQAYLQDAWPEWWQLDAANLSTYEEKAAAIMRYRCGVKSRSEIIPGTPAADAFRTLCADWENWLNCREAE